MHQAAAVVLQQRVVRPGHRHARGQQDQRVEQRDAPRIERVLEHARRRGAAGRDRHARAVDRQRRPMAAEQLVARDHADDVGAVQKVVHAGGEQGRVEVGPEPGDEEHHLRGDEEDHAVAEVQLHDRSMVAVRRPRG